MCRRDGKSCQCYSLVRNTPITMTHIEAIFQIDYGMFLLNEINEKISVKKTTIENMIDDACGYDETKELAIAAKEALNMIIEGKRFIGRDYSKEVALIAKIDESIPRCHE